MNEPDHRLKELLEAADWTDLLPRLLSYAAYRLATRGVRIGKYKKTSGQYVHRAIYEVLEGKHRYQGGTLFAFISAVTNIVIDRDLSQRKVAP